MKYKAVIFDLFGTLVDEIDREQQQSFRQVAVELGIPFERLLKIWLDPRHVRVRDEGDMDAYFRFCCRDLKISEAGAPGAAETFRAIVRTDMTPRPDTERTLRAVKALGLGTGLVTNCNGEVPNHWPKTPYAAYIDAPVFSSRVGLVKPDPRIFRLALDQLGATPTDCLYVGDGGSNELAASTALGMTAVMVRTKYNGGPEAFIRTDPPWSGLRLQFLSDILPLLAEGK